MAAERTAGEMPIATIESQAYTQGVGETLILPGCYDFDNGVSVVPPDPSCDFNILPGP